MTESTVSEVVEMLTSELRVISERPAGEYQADLLFTPDEARTLLSTIKATGGGPSREEVARVIDPEAFSEPPNWTGETLSAFQKTALTKADAVLSLFSSEGKEDQDCKGGAA